VEEVPPLALAPEQVRELLAQPTYHPGRLAAVAQPAEVNRYAKAGRKREHLDQLGIGRDIVPESLI
jgi:hypothetical protein